MLVCVGPVAGGFGAGRRGGVGGVGRGLLARASGRTGVEFLAGAVAFLGSVRAVF